MKIISYFDLGLTNANTGIHIVDAVFFRSLGHFVLKFAPELFHDVFFLLVTTAIAQRSKKCGVRPNPNGRNIPLGKLPCSDCIT